MNSTQLQDRRHQGSETNNHCLEIAPRDVKVLKNSIYILKAVMTDTRMHKHVRAISLRIDILALELQ